MSTDNLTIAMSVTFDEPSPPISLSLTSPQTFTLAGTIGIRRTQTIDTTGTNLLDVSGISDIGSYMIRNNDTVFAVQLLPSVSSGTILNQASAGRPMMGEFPPGVTAPALQIPISSPPASPPPTITVEVIILPK